VLRIHSRTMFGLGVLTPLIPEFASLYPEIQVELALGKDKVDLRRQGIDIDFRISPPAEAGLKRRKMFESKRLLVASPAYMDSRPAVEKPADLLKLDLLAYMRPGDLYHWRFSRKDKDHENRDEDLEISPRHISNNGMVLLDLALSGQGVALLDDYTVANWLDQADLIHLLPEHEVTNSTFEEGIYATFLDTPIVPAKIRTMLDLSSNAPPGCSAALTSGVRH
jgi:DNA-binding transcriptional LysR family regulator